MAKRTKKPPKHKCHICSKQGRSRMEASKKADRKRVELLLGGSEVCRQKAKEFFRRTDCGPVSYRCVV